MVQVLLEHNAELNIQTHNGITALMMSSYQGHTETARLLVSRGTDIYIATSTGMTALQFSIDNNHEKITELLREHGAIEQHEKPSMKHGPTEQCINRPSKKRKFPQLGHPSSIITYIPDTSSWEERMDKMEKILQLLVQNATTLQFISSMCCSISVL